MGENIISVGLGEFHLSRNPKDVLVCYGLGSCVGLAMYDPLNKIGAMAHIVLPESSIGKGELMPAKFADTCVPFMLQQLVSSGANKTRLIVKLAGGAQVLKVAGVNNRLDIGNRNIKAVEEALVRHGIIAQAKDLGGNYGRTFQLIISNGKFMVKSVGLGEKVL